MIDVLRVPFILRNTQYAALEKTYLDIYNKSKIVNRKSKWLVILFGAVFNPFSYCG